MPGRHETGRHGVGEDPAVPELWNASIETLYLGETAAEHDHVRVEEVDDRGESAGESVFVAMERVLARGVAGGGTLDDLLRREASSLGYEGVVTRSTGSASVNALVIVREARPREERLA